MSKDIVQGVDALGFPWKTQDPFLFCVHHDDHYPRGNAKFGPDASLRGRQIGSDFAGKDGWRMYHGETVPGFPQHPHRGFETVTLVRKGFIDHADSLGARARFGGGDCQWMTAGRGIVHSEMFPLLKRDDDNPLELFQIWLNLPKADKLVDPHFTMLWREAIPTHVASDGEGRRTQITVVAGHYGESRAPAPAPRSWAARAESDVAIWTLRLDANARWTLPATAATTRRTLYFFRGESAIRVAGEQVNPASAVQVRADAAVTLVNGPVASELLLLQGRPIDEPVMQYGPFVMNTPEEIRQAFRDYQQTAFGGWPWTDSGPVHGRETGRFATYPDGHTERPA